MNHNIETGYQLRRSKLAIASILMPILGLIMAAMAYMYFVFPYSFWIALLAGLVGVLLGAAALVQTWRRRARLGWKMAAIVGILASALWLGVSILSVAGLAPSVPQASTLTGLTWGIREYLASGPTEIGIDELTRITKFRFPPNTKLISAIRSNLWIGTSIEATLQVDRDDVGKLTHSLHVAGYVHPSIYGGKVTRITDPPDYTSTESALWRRHPAPDYMFVEGEVNDAMGADSHCRMTIGLTKSRRFWVHFQWDNT